MGVKPEQMEGSENKADLPKFTFILTKGAKPIDQLKERTQGRTNIRQRNQCILCMQGNLLGNCILWGLSTWQC